MKSDEVMASAIFEDSKENCVTYADFDAGWEAAIEWVKSGQEPVAWTWDTDGSGVMSGSCMAHFQFSKPQQEKGMNNLRPLFEHPTPAQSDVVLEFSFPRDSRCGGWRIDPSFIGKVQDTICESDDCGDLIPTMEEIESVLLAVEKLQKEATVKAVNGEV